MQVLLFELERQRMAIPLADAREVARAVLTTPLPGTPPIIEGVIDVRGTLVPVLDVRGRFRLPQRPLDPAQHMVIAWDGHRLVALRVDHVIGIGDVPGIETLSHLTSVPLDHVAGVARSEDGLIVIHDIRAFLTEAEAAALADALQDRASGEASA
jgi:purine-binding chemotaxis protein CheW